MAVYKCAGRKRIINGEPICTYEDSAPWRGPCPGCGTMFDCDEFGFSLARELLKKVTAASSVGAELTYEPTGVDCFDEVLGGGLVRGHVVLGGGPRGTGKTSVFMTVCDLVAKATKRPVVYASAEEFDAGLLVICNRLGIENEGIEILDRSRASSVHDVLAHCSAVRPYLTVFDSLQMMSSDVAQAEVNAKIINAYCKRTKMCGIVVNHMTKGLEFKGGSGVEHEVDALVAIYNFNETDDGSAKDLFGKRALREMGIAGAPNYEKALFDKIRTLAIGGKSRQGFAGAKSYFHMTEAGRIEPLSVKSKILQFPLNLGDDDD